MYLFTILYIFFDDVHCTSDQWSGENGVLREQNKVYANEKPLFSGGSDIMKLIVMCCHYR